MAARDKYSINIKCSKCGEQGILYLSENDYVFMRRLDLRVDKVKGNFSTSMKDEHTIKITCEICGDEFIR